MQGACPISKGYRIKPRRDVHWVAGKLLGRRCQIVESHGCLHSFGLSGSEVKPCTPSSFLDSMLCVVLNHIVLNPLHRCIARRSSPLLSAARPALQPFRRTVPKQSLRRSSITYAKQGEGNTQLPGERSQYLLAQQPTPVMYQITTVCYSSVGGGQRYH